MYLGTETETAVKGRPVAFNGDGHLLTIGPTRSGKSRRLLIPNLLYETGRSFLVIDIKGELTAATAAHRAAMGNSVMALDPFGVLAKRGIKVPSVGFNPMTLLDPVDEGFVDDAMMLAEALVQVKPNDSDPHWAESAQDLVAALIMLLRCTRGDKAHLGMVRQEVARSPTKMRELAISAIDSNAPDAICNKLSKYTEGGESRELASILSNAQTQTRFLDSAGIERNLSEGSLDFGILKEQPTTVYLVLPPERLLTHAKWLRLVISAAMTAMQRTSKVTGRPDVVFMLDEFPQLGRLSTVETAVSLNAGFGVKVWACVQHLGQLKDHYGENWETFLSAGCVTTFAPRDVFTRDHLTRLMGTGSKILRSTSYSSQGGTSITESVQKDDLISPHEWRAMVLGEQWAFIPTKGGQLVKRLSSIDFTDLPEVKSGVIRPGSI